MNKLQNYALGKWTAGAEEGQTLYNAINGDAFLIKDFACMEILRNQARLELSK